MSEALMTAMPHQAWEKSTAPKLENNDMHIWLIDFLQNQHSIDQAYSLLSAKEKQQAQHFRFNRHRLPYIIFHGAMRSLLSRYLINVSAQAIQYQTIKNDKPIIHPEQNPQQLHFNLSHSDNLALLAICNVDVGIDIEKINSSIEISDLIKHYYTVNEAADIEAMPTAEHSHGFFTLWARKESYMKLSGLGLSIEPNSFEVSSPTDQAKLLKTNNYLTDVNCIMQDITLPGKHRQFAACVSTSTALQLKTFSY